jgi:hypothetical protein
VTGIIEQALDLSWKDAWMHELRGKHGEWTASAAADDLEQAFNHPYSAANTAGGKEAVAALRRGDLATARNNLENVNKVNQDQMGWSAAYSKDKHAPVYQEMQLVSKHLAEIRQRVPDSTPGEPVAYAIAAANEGIIGQYLDLASKAHDTAIRTAHDTWEREHRDRHGRWTSSADEALDTTQGRMNDLKVIVSKMVTQSEGEGNPDEAKALRQIGADLDKGDTDAADKAVQGLITAVKAKHGSAWVRAERYSNLAKALASATAPADTQLISHMTSRAKTEQPIVMQVTHGTNSIWDGKVDLFATWQKSDILAEMGWDGTLHMNEATAKSLDDSDADPSKPIEDLDSHIVPIHEFIHAEVPPGTQDANRLAYQDYATSQIEEGFTQLGAAYHGPEYMARTGEASRPTKAGKTLGEVAQDNARPEAIAAGNSWGPYPRQTRDAQEWVQVIAKEEGFRDFTPGSSGFERAIQLTDDINRQGAAGKMKAMARQMALAEITNPKLRFNDNFVNSLVPDIEQNIKTEWAKIQPSRAQAAFNDSKSLATTRIQQMEQAMAMEAMQAART